MAHVSVKSEAASTTVVTRAVIGLMAVAWLIGFVGCGDAGNSDFATVPTIPSRARWHNNQGVVYMDQHNYARASAEFNKAIALAPAYASGLTNLGIAYFSLGQYDSAAVSLRNALRSDPDQLNAHYTLGLIYNAQGREHHKALLGFERVLRSDPDDPLLRYYLGQVKIKLDRADEGMEEFREAIRLDPTHVSAHYALANQLRRQGRQEEWQEILAKFQDLSQAGHEGISASYQGQGKYAEVVADAEVNDPGVSDLNGPIHFTRTAAGDGQLIDFATMADLDGDQLPELVNGGHRPIAHILVSGAFSPAPDTQFSFPVTGAWHDANFGDWDSDGDPDLVLSGAPSTTLENVGSGAWVPSLNALGEANRAIYADVDHDGDLDLLVLRSASVGLYSNDGDGGFTDITQAAGFAQAGPVRRAVFTDLDNDRDIDVLMLGQGRTALYANNRDGTFSDVADTVGLARLEAMDVMVEDMDRDGFMDLLALSSDGTIVELRNQRGRSFEPASESAVGSYQHLAAADLDNDGDQDLVAYGTDGIRPLARYRGRFEAQEAVGGASVGEIHHLLVEDLDQDGALDLWTDGGQWNNAADSGNWLTIRLEGLNSNLDAVGTKVEVKTAGHQQKLEVRGDSDNGRDLHFGLALEDSVEFIRVLWPGGVRQTELATHGRRTLTLKELDRKGTSCPILYVWDGERFRFETDILGGGIIGYLVGKGEYYTPDTDEYIPLTKVEPLDGDYVVQIANQLEEIVYLDAVELIAIEHDPEVSVLPNERLLSAPPYPDFRLFPLVNLRPPLNATDGHGQDILATISEVDDEWAHGFEKTAIHGYVSDHHIVLDLGDLSTIQHPVLVGHGWVDYAHSTSNWAASERGLSLYPPRLEVPDHEGNWVVAMDDLGMPAGLPKKLVVDLSGLFTSKDYRVRLTTNAAVYWDQFLVGERVQSDIEVTRLGNAGGDLHWRGYPRHTAIKGTFAFRYDYDDLVVEADWGTHAGSFTRFGEVGELLETIDDRYVIMYHGDELTVRFDADALPPLAEDRARSFLLYADGFGKDMDLHSAHSLTVAPLPFHAMSTYPYPADEHYPQDAEHAEYVVNYNTRRIRGYYE